MRDNVGDVSKNFAEDDPMWMCLQKIRGCVLILLVKKRFK